MIVDFHNHFFPMSYLQELQKGQSQAKLGRNSDGQLMMSLSGDYSIILETHHNAVARLEAMDAAGVDVQCLTLTVPGVHSEAAAQGVHLARLVNDGFGEIIQQHPSRYTALAALPLQEPAAAVAELERAVTQLGLRGGGLFTHINGQQLDQSAFWPLYEKAVELDVPLFIHPIIPTHIGALGDYRLVAVAGFLYETTTAVLRLIYSGVLERYPGLKLVLSHLGGTAPFLAERADRGFALYPECQGNISRPPSSYLRDLYMDTYPGVPNAIQFAIDFAGADKLVLGSDYPHQIGDLPGSIRTITDLAISEADKGLILGGNAVRLLKLKG